MYLINSAQILGTGSLPTDISTPPKFYKNVSMCLRNFQRKFGALGPNRSWDIDLPTPPCICPMWPSFGALAVCPQVSQHLPSGLEILLCVSGTSQKCCACKHNEKWTQLNFRGAHTWAPRGEKIPTHSLFQNFAHAHKPFRQGCHSYRVPT